MTAPCAIPRTCLRGLLGDCPVFYPTYLSAGVVGRLPGVLVVRPSLVRHAAVAPGLGVKVGVTGGHGDLQDLHRARGVIRVRQLVHDQLA